MAKSPAKAAGKKGAAPGKANAKYKFLAYIFSPLIVYLGFGTFVLACGGMLPTLVAYIVDRRGDRHAVKTVGYMNGCGVAIVAEEMWAGEHTWRRALDLLGDPVNWLIMFGAAAVGWVLFFALPPMVKAYMKVTQELRLKTLTNQQEKLLKEWGEDVSRNAPKADVAQERATRAAAMKQAQQSDSIDLELTGDEDESALLALVDGPLPGEDEVIESIAEIGEKKAG